MFAAPTNAPLLEGTGKGSSSAPPVRPRVSALQQLGTLLLRKELLLKARRPVTTLLEVIFPVGLCAILIIGAYKSQTYHVPATGFAPQNSSDAIGTLLPEVMAPVLLSNLNTGPTADGLPDIPIPGAVPPLGLFLFYINYFALCTHVKDLQPADGSILAVSPDTAEVRALIEVAVNDTDMKQALRDIDARPPIKDRVMEDLRGSCAKHHNKTLLPDNLADILAPVPTAFFEDGEALRHHAYENGNVWAGIVFESVGDDGNWSYTLSFNVSAVPKTGSFNGETILFDKFNSGLSNYFFQYYASGFLSLQTALNTAIYNASGANVTAVPWPYGVPYPIAAYTHNLFFNYAGNLIGLVLVFSFLIPLSTMLRALVLEKESRLRELILIMGTSLQAYYASILATYGVTFIVIAVISATEIGLSCYTHSDFSLVIVFFVLFALSALAFTLALSPFFKNARVAALLGPLLFFLSSQLYNLFLDQGRLVQGMAAGKMLASFLPAMAFYLGASEMSMYEGSQQGITWATMWEGDWPFGASLVMLAIDIGLYVGLAWYLDQVVPSEFGLQRRPWFLCTPSYWCGASRRRADGGGGLSLGPLQASAAAGAGAGAGADGAQLHAPLVVEALPELAADELEHGVRTRGLRKVYPKGVAVHGLDLEMRRGQITALLGANGAGKTTTISMLTGLIPPDGGDAWIDGLSIRSAMVAIRQSLGVCPQLNTIFAQLTPAQHLRLYGALKGLRGAELEATIRTLLEQVTLAEKTHTNAEALSGGQKRKLCLAVSLIGASSTVFLDEPTSGMDPHSRRAIWALLRSYREGRAVVLTTHFLDEAEILSDAIAIMAEGQLRCFGSVVFLKARLGVGYRLAVTKQPSGFDAGRVLQLLQKELPDAALLRDRRLEAEYQLPGQDMRAFASAFAALEAKLPSLGCADYGVTCTTLEDIFLRINENALLRLASNEENRTPQPSPPQPDRRGAPAPDAPPAAAADGAGGAAATLALGAPTEALLAPQHQQQLPQHQPPPPPPPPPPQSTSSTSSTGALLRQYVGLVHKRRLTSQRDKCTTCCQLLFPVVLVLIALALLNVDVSAVGPRLPLTPADAMPGFMGPDQGEAVPLLYARNGYAAPELGGFEAEGWSPLPVAGCASRLVPLANNLTDYLAATPDIDRGAAVGLAEPVDEPAAAGSVPLPLGLPSTAQWAITMFNSTSIWALPTLVASVFNETLHEATGGAHSINAATHALPRTKRTVAEYNSFISLFASIMILIPLAFAAASFVTPLVRERESGSKQMQFVSGVTGPLYWLASWTWDAALYLVLTAALLVVFLLMKRSEFTGDAEKCYATLSLLLLFGWATLPLSSFVSFFFQSPSNGLITMIAFHFLSGFGLIVADFIMTSIGGSTADVDADLRNLYYLCPAYCLGRGFFALSTRDAFSAFGIAPKPIFSWQMVGGPLVYLFGEGVVFGCLTLLIQTLAAYGVTTDALRPRSLLAALRGARVARTAPVAAARGAAAPEQHECSDLTSSRSDGGAPRAAAAFGSTSSTGGGGGGGGLSLEDDSVAAERQAVDASDFGADELVLRHLRKQYAAQNGARAGKVAVRDLCLRIQPGECFGFLGVNGAGKSTTFSMLTGAVLPTSGDATLYGLSILRDQRALRRHVGYCPQHDALEALLTGRETLRMYARIKQVAAEQIEAEVEGLLQDLDLAKFADKPAGTYSGGNKRKLCVGIALVGSPSLVLLDEPSSGMDAASKRFLWTVIKRRTARCCTVLTTHSMEECEALCGRLGVMVDGTLRCVGPIQSLKSRYGQGYRLELRMDAAAVEAAAAAPSATQELSITLPDHAVGGSMLTVQTPAGMVQVPLPPDVGPGMPFTFVAPAAGGAAARIVEFVQQRCPEAQLEELEPPSITFTVPTASSSLSQLFGHLAEAQKELQVGELSVTQCTLEQVFILMASKQQLRNQGSTSAAAPPPM